MRWLAHIIAFAIGAVCVASLVTAGASATPAIFLAVIGYWYMLRPIEVRWLLRRRFAKRPDAGASVECTASEKGLSVSAGDLARAELAWKAVFKCVRVRRGFLLYHNEAIWHWLPDSGFASPELADRFRRLAEDKAPRFEHRG